MVSKVHRKRFENGIVRARSTVIGGWFLMVDDRKNTILRMTAKL